MVAPKRARMASTPRSTTAHRSRLRRGVFAGCILGVATGWNIANVGSVAADLAGAYGVALAGVGLLTTALFLTHVAIQVPGGRASDRFGPRVSGVAALAAICAGNLLALVSPTMVVGLAGRAITGLGTGLAFISGSALVRESGGSPFAQGVFGGIGLGAGGLALAIVPQLEPLGGWRTPYLTALVLAVAAAAAVVVLGARDEPRDTALPSRARPRGVVGDPRLRRVAAMYAASYGLSVVLGNWVIELLERHSTLTNGQAAVVGALTLLLGIVTRPLGGWILRARPRRARAAVAIGVAGGGLGTVALLVAAPAWLSIGGGLLVGIGAGLPFSPAFTAAAALRPDAPAAAVGLVNAVANSVVLAGTPLVGLTFAMAGGGRIGFAVIAALWFAALAALPSGGTLAGTPGAASVAAPAR